MISDRRKLPPIAPDEMDQAKARPADAGTFAPGTSLWRVASPLARGYGPPSMVVNENCDIVHLSESAGRYLHFAPGNRAQTRSRRFIRLCKPNCEPRCIKRRSEKRLFPAPLIDVGQDGTSELIRLEVRPMRATDEAHGFYLVLFQRDTATAAPVARPGINFRTDERRDPIPKGATGRQGRAVRSLERRTESFQRRAPGDERGDALGHGGTGDEQGRIAIG